MSRIRTVSLPHLGDIQVVIKTRRDISDETPLDKRDEESLGWGYWDKIWPSEMALAEFLVQEYYPDKLKGLTVMEIGCGVGLAGVVAAQLGAFTMLSDMVPITLVGVKETCEINQITNFDTCILDWSSSIDLTEQYDIVIGSEVFYDKNNLPDISKVLNGVLKTGGQAFFSDPNRLGLNTIEFHFRKRFTLSIEKRRFNEALWKNTGGKKTGYIYTLKETGIRRKGKMKSSK